MVVNTRALNSGNITGVERYLLEVLSHITETKITKATPPLNLKSGLKGLFWENFILPTQLNKQLLWSPTNLGPLLVKKQVVSIMDFTTIDHPEWFDKRFALLYQTMLPIMAKRTLHTIAISEYTKKRIVEETKISESKVTVTLLAADNKFRPVGFDKVNELKNRIGVQTNYVLVVGSLEPRKNLKRLFEAWSNWQNRPDDLEMLVAGGTGKAFKSIGFSDLPRGIKLLGRVSDEDLPILYSGSLFFIYPSLYEGFGLPPLEAMACGTPVISSNTTSIPEVVGEAGLLINPNSVGEILDAIQEMYKNTALRQRYSKEGIERAKLFSWENTAKETVNILKSFE